MRPLTFQFKEKPVACGDFDCSLIEYDEKLNLTVNRATGRPAIDEAHLGTDTYTRVTGEGTDSDYTVGSVGMLMATETATKTSGEGVDSDRSVPAMLLGTATTMVGAEGTDADK
jgi:hypothetical protein